MGSCAAPSAKGDDKFITTDYLQQCHIYGLTNQFTTYSLRDCGSLRNPRTIRLYESLAQFKSSGLWVTTHAWLNDRFLLPESQQKNLAELKRSFLDPALKQINEKTPLLAKYSIDDSGKFLFSIIDKQNPV